MDARQQQLVRSLAMVVVAGAAGWFGAGGLAVGLVAGAGGEAIKEIIARIKPRVRKSPAAKGLLDGLSQDLTAWATAEGVNASRADITAGLKLAVETVIEAKVTLDDLAAAGYDAARVAGGIVRMARTADAEWAHSSEARLVIAERAIGSAYRRLVREVAVLEPAQLASFRELSGRIQAVELRQAEIEARQNAVQQASDDQAVHVEWSDVREATAVARRDLAPDTLPSIDRTEWIRATLQSAGGLPSPLAVIGDGGLGKSVIAGQIHDELTSAGEAVVIVPCSTVPRSAPLTTPGDVNVALGQAALGREAIVPLTAMLDACEDVDPWLLIDTVDLLLNDTSARAVRTIIGTLAAQHRVIVLCREREWHDFRLADALDSHSELLLPRLNPSEIVSWGREFASADGVTVSPEFEESLRLASLAGGASEVLGVPLRLAMACELYAGREAIPDDLTVVSLYRAYWDRRIGRDRDGLRGETARTQERAALLVAEAIWTGSAERFAEWVASPGGAAPSALARLLGEGVLRESAHRVRFFHQTFAEFAVAQHLLAHADEPDLEFLRSRLAENDSGMWGVASYLLTPELETSRYEPIAAAIPADTAAGMRILLRGGLERVDERESQELIEALVVETPEQVSLFPELFLSVDDGRREAAASTILTLLVSATRPANRLADVAALLSRGLDEEARERILVPALSRLSSRGAHVASTQINPVVVRLMSGFPAPLSVEDAESIIGLYPHLPAPAQAAAIRQAVASLAALPSGVIAQCTTAALAVELPKGAVDDGVVLLLSAWAGERGRVGRGWHTWRGLLYAEHPERWDAAQIRATARAAGDDDPIFTELLSEALWPTTAEHRARLTNAAEFVATWWPERIVPAVLQLGVADSRAALATACAITRRVLDRVDLPEQRALVSLLTEKADVDPMNVWPTLLRLAVRDATSYASVVSSLREFLRSDAAAGARTRRNCFEALLHELPPAVLVDHLALLEELTAGSDRIDRVNAAVLQATLAPVSDAARTRAAQVIVAGRQTTAATAAAKALHDGLDHWDPAELDTEGVAWFAGLLATPVPKAAEHIAACLQARISGARWTADMVTVVVDRLVESLERGEDSQVSDKLRPLLAGLVRLDDGLVPADDVERVLAAYQRGLDAPGAASSGRGALWIGLNSTVSALAFLVLSQSRVEELLAEILLTDTTTISARAARSTAATLVGFLERHPLRFPLIEELWPTMPEPARLAVAETLNRGNVPGKAAAAQRLVGLGASDQVTARLMSIIETGGVRRAPVRGDGAS